MALFVPNRNFLKEITDGTLDFIEDEAQKAAGEANALQHRIMRSRPDRIKVEREPNGVWITNPNKGGHLDEWGSINNPAYAPLRNGVINAGFDFEPM